MPSDMGGDVDTLVVGIDACEPSLLRSLFEDADVPTLRSVFDDAATASLESQIPPWTASAWPSMYTGTNPGRHGIFDFLAYDGYDWGVVNATHVMEPSLWELLDHQDRRSVVVNVPMTHPPEPFDGALIPGFTAPEDPTCHPSGVLDDVREAIGGYRVYPTPGSDEANFEEYLECIEMRGGAFRYLVDRFEPAFGFLQFQATDTVFHQYSGEETELIRTIYEAVDDELAAVLDVADPGTVFVVSDHGIGEYDGYEFRINNHLREEGFLRTKRGGRGMPSWHVVRDSSLLDGEQASVRQPTPIERVVAVAARAGLTTRRVGRLLDALGLGELARRHAPPGVVKVSNEQVDFPGSVAYMRSRVETGVRVNLAGREPDGIVPEDEYEWVRDRLIETLEAVETPDGEPVFEDVARREAYFEGPHDDRAVDVVTVPDGWDHFLSAQIRDDTFAAPSEPWNHKMQGVFAATGTAVDEDVPIEEAHLLDVAPTVLAALGVPPSDRMERPPLPVVDPVDPIAYPARPGRTDRPVGEGDVQERLAALGYVE